MGSDRAPPGAQAQQELWRPSEQVLHLLERNQNQSQVWAGEERRSSEAEEAAPGEEQAVVIKRQAPAVWRPPVAMKPNYAPPPPVDEWQLPEEQPKLLDPFTFLGDDHHPHNERATEEQDSKSNNASRDNDSYDNNEEEEEEDEEGDEQAPKEFPGENDEGEGRELMPPPRAREGSTLGSFIAATTSTSSSFHQRMVPQTPLFTGLGSVTFSSGGGFSVPTSASIFGQNSSFNLGISSPFEKDEPGEKRMAEEAAQPSTSNRFTRSQANYRFQRLNTTVSLSEKGTSLSEKGSSDSLAGNTNAKLMDVQSGKNGNANANGNGNAGGNGNGNGNGNGTFKPSGLAGKSLVSSCGGIKDSGVPPVPGKKSGRKLRTRPMDLLMNAIQATDSKSKTVGGGGGGGGVAPAQASSPQARTSMRTRSSTGKLASKSETGANNNNNSGSKRSSNEKDRISSGSGDLKRGAYFAHTGAWIVQKKSSRTARNAFKREEEEMPPSSNSNVNVKGRAGGAVGNGHGSGRHVTKKRSLTAMSQPEGAQQQATRTDENGGNKVSIVRSKRGRCHALPSRLQDSDLTTKVNKAKKANRK